VSGLEQIAYDNAIRALDKQENVLEELRARTGVLLAAASLAASLLRSGALDDPHPIALLVVALIAFAVVLAACLFVLMPRSFVFSLEGPAVYERLYEFRNDPAEIHRWLAYQLQRFWEENDRRMAPVKRAFRAAATGLVVEVICLTVLVAGIL
jgi:hypothetical protein